MLAAAITRYGQPPAAIERPKPSRREGWALIHVEAAPIDALDLLCATGTSYFGQHPLPYIPGVEGAGVVMEADRLEAGTRVWFTTDAGMKPIDGSMAQFALVEEANASTIGATDPVLAASLGLSAVAACLALTKIARLRAGEQVLVLGTGAVGRLAVQMAHLLGARRVVAAGRTAASLDRLRALGAADAVEIAPGQHDQNVQRLRAALDGELTLVLDTLAGDAASAALAVLSAGGRLVNLGSSAGSHVSVPSSLLRSGEITIAGYTNARASFAEKAGAMHRILGWCAAAGLVSDHERVPLTDVAAAWLAQRNGSSRKLVLTL